MNGHVFDKSLKGLYAAVGGIDAFRRISKRFHDKIEQDPSLRGFFPKSLAAQQELLALYLAERTGGPSDYATTRGKTSLFCRHAHLPIGAAEANSWLEHMAASLGEEGVKSEASRQLLSNLAELAATLADPFVMFYRLPVTALREKLLEDPSLARANDRGWNLICPAAAAWDVPRLRLLLEFGANVDTKDGGGHNPLYRAANGRGREDEGREAVELLIEHGADVNQATGVGGMTPLHMSARRGTTGIAEALLNAGAGIEAIDKTGQTPLRRAVNCGQERMVSLLLTSGANPQSKDKHGRTPVDAARTDKMGRLLAAHVL